MHETRVFPRSTQPSHGADNDTTESKGMPEIPNRIPGISEVIKPMYELRSHHRNVHEEPVLARGRVLDECFRSG